VALRAWTPPERSALAGLALVAPGPSASFEIDPLDWLRTPPEDPATRVAPAVQALGVRALCVQGADDTESACRDLPGDPLVRVARLPGSHHFDGNYEAVGDSIAVFVQSIVGRAGAIAGREAIDCRVASAASLTSR
jgi:type IV secretory pathway VirJ component